MKKQLKAILFVLLMTNAIAGMLWASQVPSNNSLEADSSQSLRISTVSTLIDEMQANEYFTGEQSRAWVSRLTNDTFVVVWKSAAQDGDQYGIFATVFNATTGANLTPEFQVNANPSGTQVEPQVCGISNTTFVVAWTDSDGGSYSVFARVFDDTGTAITGDIQINNYTTNYQINPSIARLTDSTFVIAWQSKGQDGSDYGIYATVFSAATGANLTPEVQLNTHTQYDQRDPSVFALSGDTFAVAWHSQLQDGSSWSIYGSVFNATNCQNLTNEFRVNTFNAGAQDYPSLTALTTTSFAVAWRSENQDGDGNGIFATVIDATTGDNLIAELRVNTNITNHQEWPEVSRLTENSFGVVWQSLEQDGSNAGIFAAVIDASTGDVLLEDFQVNTYWTNHQQYPSITTLIDNTFVVAWQSNGPDGDYYGVFFSKFEFTPPSGNGNGIPGYQFSYLICSLTLVTTIFIIFLKKRNPSILKN